MGEEEGRGLEGRVGIGRCARRSERPAARRCGGQWQRHCLPAIAARHTHQRIARNESCCSSFSLFLLSLTSVFITRWMPDRDSALASGLAAGLRDGGVTLLGVQRRSVRHPPRANTGDRAHIAPRITMHTISITITAMHVAPSPCDVCACEWRCSAAGDALISGGAERRQSARSKDRSPTTAADDRRPSRIATRSAHTLTYIHTYDRRHVADCISFVSLVCVSIVQAHPSHRRRPVRRWICRSPSLAQRTAPPSPTPRQPATRTHTHSPSSPLRLR